MSSLLISSLVFVFLLGLCVGSFLNVVVYRLPAGKSLVYPPSACPKCGHRLAWYDNVPVLGWIWLGGKCRYCREPISVRYPVVELATGVLFLGYAVAVFVLGMGPCVPGVGPMFSAAGLPLARPLANIGVDWPMLALHLGLIGALLAASLIDLDTFTIPGTVTLFMAVLGVIGHTFLVTAKMPGNLVLGADLALAGAGAAVGYVLAVGLYQMKVIPLSFPEGEPMMLDRTEWEAEIAAAKAEGREPEVPAEPPKEWTRGMLNREMVKEVSFCLPVVVGFVVGLVLTRHTGFGGEWARGLARMPMVAGLLGSVLGGLVGGGAIWVFRIGGTVGFGKLAMGLGDVHLMAAVGAVTGGIVATSAIFAGAVWGLCFAVYGFVFKSQREFPFGPYLALGTVTALLWACGLETTLGNAWAGVVQMVSGGR